MAFWLAAIGTAVAVIGAGVSSYAAVKQIEQQEKAAKTEAQLREQEAESTRQTAEYNERQFRRRLSFLMGQQTAITAAAGIDPVVGSPLQQELDTVRQGEMEALNIRANAGRMASAQEFEARLMRSRASYFRSNKYTPFAAGAAEAGGSVLSMWAKRAGPKPQSELYGV